MLDGPIASQQPLPDPVMFVAEGGVPGDDEVIGEVEGDGNRVWHFPAVLFREDATRHIGSGGKRQVESAHNPGDLMHHILRHVSARELPEQAPIDKRVGIERPRASAIEEQVPAHVGGCAVRRHGAHPLTLPMRGVAAHPSFDLGHFAYHAVLDPLFRIGQGAGALVLQPDGHDLTRALGRRETLLRLRDRPGHGLLAVEVLARGERVEKVPRVNVERARHKHSIDVFPIEQPPVIPYRADARHNLAGFLVTAGVDIGHGHAFDIGKRDYLLEQLLPACARADQADADAIIGSEHPSGRIGQPRGAAGSES